MMIENAKFPSRAIWIHTNNFKTIDKAENKRELISFELKKWKLHPNLASDLQISLTFFFSVNNFKLKICARTIFLICHG